MRCDNCPLCPIAEDDVCPESEGEYGLEHKDGVWGCRHPYNWAKVRADEYADYLGREADGMIHDMKIEHEGFNKGLNKAYQEICILEEECIDHTENEDGEWVTMTIDYGKWADILMKLEQIKEQTDE